MENHLFVLTLVPDEGRYLVIEERDRTFYLPAGRVEPGENLMAAAVRETAEEAGVLVGLRGLLGVDHAWHGGRGRLRFCFVGYQGIAGPPKSRPDAHSRGARWATRGELARLPLRDPEVLTWIDRYEAGATLLPCAAYGWRGPEGPRFDAILG